jgi:glycosyltransferase involved in cell wall biosynthesis
MLRFSIVIITYNEEKNIERCLNSLVGLSDNTVVVDALSSDDTRSICTAMGAVVTERAWTGYGDAKNYGSSQADYDWILSIDSDEVCTPQLLQSLSGIESPEADKVFAVKRINHIGSRPLTYGHLHPEWKPRLFHRRHYQWNDNRIHEILEPKVKNAIKLQGDLFHFQAQDIEELNATYTKYAALSRGHSHNDRHSRIKHLWALVSAIYHFKRSYLLMGGFLEGRLGAQLALARARMAYHKRI